MHLPHRGPNDCVMSLRVHSLAIPFSLQIILTPEKQKVMRKNTYEMHCFRWVQELQ